MSLGGLLVGTLLLCHPLQTQAQTAERPPNILWIVSEDNSPLIGAYGDTFATTPNIDKLATQGVLYTNAFAVAPVCAPSRSCLITGMYPPGLGTENMRSTYAIPNFVKFYPKYLREAGYYTTNNAKKDYNVAQDQEEAWDESSGKATYANRKPGQPFFAVFNIGTSHESSIHNSTPTAKLRHKPADVTLPPYHPDTPEMRHDWAQYYDKVEDMDTEVGQFLADLEKSGEAENTIVFYYSDHGGVLGRSKRFMYESGLHIPMVIRFPKKYAHLAPGKPDTKTDRIVTFLDFAPTLLSLAGVDIPDYMQGKAFLGKQTATARAYANAFRGPHGRAYRPGARAARQEVPLHPQLHAAQDLRPVHRVPVESPLNGFVGGGLQGRDAETMCRRNSGKPSPWRNSSTWTPTRTT